MSRSEAEAIERDLSPPSRWRAGELAAPLVFNSPHSGRVYPSAFLASFQARRADAPPLRGRLCRGAVRLRERARRPLLYAHFPRAYLDVNREPYELDPALIRDGLPHYANTQSVRVVGGLGTIARIVSESDEIYREPLSLVAALERINRLYTPYHDTLKSLLAEARQAFGLAVLVDCHSMPSNPISDQGGARPDFVLGDRYGTSCSGELTRAAAPGAESPRLCGGVEQALCRRLHHRALRPAACRCACPSSRGQPRALYAREHL